MQRLFNNSFVHKLLQFVLHTKTAYDLRMWPNFERRSSGQGQGHLQEKYTIRALFISFLIKYFGISFSTQRLLIIEGYVVSLSKGDLGKIKVTERKSAELVTRQNLFDGETLEVLTSHRSRLLVVDV